jgi:hypothetical protein
MDSYLFIKVKRHEYKQEITMILKINLYFYRILLDNVFHPGISNDYLLR